MSCAGHEMVMRKGMLCTEDVDLIQRLVGLLPKEHVNVLELGCGFGSTAVAVFSARAHNLYLYSGDLQLDRIDHTRESIKEYGGEGWLSRWKFRRGDACELFDTGWRPKQIDMFMLDTGHEYDKTLRQLETWIPSLPSRTPIWLHDYTPEKEPDCVRAIDQYVQESGMLTRLGTEGWSWFGERKEVVSG